jgi:EpsI family protein
MRYYERDDDLPITLAIVYGTDLGDFHQPEMCLEGGGLHTIRRGTARVRDAQGKPFQAVSLIMESDYDRQAFVFWFSSEGTTATFLGSYKVKVFLNRLFARKVQPSALIRLSTLALDSDEEAVSRLVRFAEALQPYLKQEFTAEGTD